MCDRTGRADSQAQHKRDLIACGCVVCRDYLQEFYSVKSTVEIPEPQQTLAKF